MASTKATCRPTTTQTKLISLPSPNEQQTRITNVGHTVHLNTDLQKVRTRFVIHKCVDYFPRNTTFDTLFQRIYDPHSSTQFNFIVRNINQYQDSNGTRLQQIDEADWERVKQLSEAACTEGRGMPADIPCFRVFLVAIVVFLSLTHFMGTANSIGWAAIGVGAVMIVQTCGLTCRLCYGNSQRVEGLLHNGAMTAIAAAFYNLQHLGQALAAPRLIMLPSLPGNRNNMHLEIERGVDIMRQLTMQGVQVSNAGVRLSELQARTKMGSVQHKMEIMLFQSSFLENNLTGFLKTVIRASAAAGLTTPDPVCGMGGLFSLHCEKSLREEVYQCKVPTWNKDAFDSRFQGVSAFEMAVLFVVVVFGVLRIAGIFPMA